MSFVNRNYAIVSTAGYDSEAPQMFAYKSADDTLATIKGSGYFNNVRPLPNVKDFIIIYGSDSSDIVVVTTITPNVLVVSGAETALANGSVTGPKTELLKFYSSVAVLTNGTTPVEIFGTTAPSNLTLTFAETFMTDVTAGDIILKNNGATVTTITKTPTLGASRGAITMSNTSVTALDSVTVESTTVGNVFAIVNFTAP